MKTLTLPCLLLLNFMTVASVREVAFERDAAGRVVGFRVVEGRTIGVAFRWVE